MDLLIPLYRLRSDLLNGLQGAIVRRPIGPEHDLCVRWVAAEFGRAWASEAGVALQNRPPSLFMAVHSGALIGFACYDATARGMFGPIGVAPAHRARGVGAALARACLEDMRVTSYAYAVAGSAASIEFFRKQAPVIEIPDSSPGLYEGMLRASDPTHNHTL